MVQLTDRNPAARLFQLRANGNELWYWSAPRSPDVQGWAIARYGDYIRFRNQQSERCLHVEGGTLSMPDCNTWRHQQWS